MNEKTFNWTISIMGIIAVILVVVMAITGNQMTDDLADIVKELKEIEQMSLQMEVEAAGLLEDTKEPHSE